MTAAGPRQWHSVSPRVIPKLTDFVNDLIETPLRFQYGRLSISDERKGRPARYILHMPWGMTIEGVMRPGWDIFRAGKTLLSPPRARELDPDQVAEWRYTVEGDSK